MRVLGAVLWLLSALAAGAVQPDEMLEDPKLEARARAISKELRCLVCRNESIDESNAELARDLRIVVRERLAAGDSDAEVIGFVVARYGDYVLLRPRLSGANWVLWLAGPALLLAGAGVVLVLLRRNGAAPVAAALTAEEEAALARLTQGQPPGGP
jgi:cytochrome c-type biogenesis protein CcmH